MGCFEGWDQVQKQLLTLFWGLFFTFVGPNGLFLSLRWGSKTVLRSTQVVQQLQFSMIPSILKVKFYLILGSFLIFFEPLWAV